MSTAEGEHSLREFLDPRLISMNLAATTRRQAVEELTGLLVRAGKVCDARAFVVDVWPSTFDEASAAGTGLFLSSGRELMALVLGARP